MLDYRLLFHLAAAAIFLIGGILAYALWLRSRTKYNLATFMMTIVLFVGTILSYVFPGELIPGAGIVVQILPGLVIVALLSAFFSYPYVKWFFSRRPLVTDNPDRRDKAFQHALKKSPRSLELLDYYASFLWTVRKNYDRAEECFLKAIQLGPKAATTMSMYARFLTQIRKDYDRAEDFFKKAIALDPKNAFCYGNYAGFLGSVRKDYNRAEEYFLKAAALDPKNASILGAFANFLSAVHKDYDRAEDFFKKAIALDPKVAQNIRSYAFFLMDIRQRYDLAERYFKKAIRLEPENSENLAAYAFFLLNVRKDYEGAKSLYEKAIALDPENAANLGSYAEILIAQGNLDEAKIAIMQTLEHNREHKNLEMELAMHFYSYALFYQDFPGSEAAIKALLAQGVRHPAERFLQKVLELAKKSGHPAYDKLSQYERMIAGTPA